MNCAEITDAFRGLWVKGRARLWSQNVKWLADLRGQWAEALSLESSRLLRETQFLGARMDKVLSLNDIRARCSEFVVNWREKAGDEKQEAQEFVRDLLLAFGVNDRKAALFEKRVQRTSTANQGFIDCLIPGLLIVEMKSAGRNLGIAEAQALDYIQHLTDAEAPRYVLSSDFKNFRLLDLKAPRSKDTKTFSLEQLASRAEDLAFLAGYETSKFGDGDQEQASIKAAKLMAELYEALEGSGYSDHESSIFLVRTLFILFADDSGIWPRGLFTNFLSNRTSPDGSDLGPMMGQLFEVLNTPLEGRQKNLDESFANFPYVNGGIFAEHLHTAAFDRVMHEKLLKANSFDWAPISPAIFGSLFQAVKSAEARRELGEHYTTETNILKTIGPLFLDELKSNFQKCLSDVNGLKRLREELGRIRVLDPACGCGNFLVVAYRELRSLELQILVQLEKLGDKTARPTMFFERTDLAVQLHNIFGIELEEWPASIAQTALILTEHKSNLEMSAALGMAPSVLPLETFEGIHIGNALRTDWHSVIRASNHTYVVGNPPFIGHISKNPEQTEDLKHVWGQEYDGYLDYVTGWFRKASDYFEDCPLGRFAFVSTNSIAQGQPVAPLFRPLFNAGWRIRYAHQSFAWSSEAPGMAHVHCVITGWDKALAGNARLFVYPHAKSEPLEISASKINGYLIDGPNIFLEKRTTPLSKQLPPTFAGSMANDGGNLIVERQDLSEVQSDLIAKKYLRKFVMGNELINAIDRWCLWLADADPKDISNSEILRRRVAAVKDLRSRSTREATRKLAATPHLFGENHQPNTRYLAIPSVWSEGRLWATCEYLEPSVIAGNKVYTAEDPEGFAFAIISSSMFITWQKAIGGRLKSDPSFSNTVVWNNLPVPHVTDDFKTQIIKAGKEVLVARAKFPSRSLADLYNTLAMDSDLLKAHAALDRVVDRAFGAAKTCETNEQRLEILFARYAELTGQGAQIGN
jgi:hypothetical protein